MRNYQIHTIESAPEKSKASLQGLKQAFGLVPNLAATMANYAGNVANPALEAPFQAQEWKGN